MQKFSVHSEPSYRKLNNGIEIHDNFLPPNICKSVCEPFLCNTSFQSIWSKGPVNAYKHQGIVLPHTKTGNNSLEIEEKYNYQFTHVLFSHYDRSELFNAIEPIITKLRIKGGLLRAKVNFNPCTDKIFEYQYHIDHEFPHWTAIYYMNTNNGGTKCEDGTLIESVKNRLAILPWKTFHTGTSSTDDNRTVLNMNWMVQNEECTDYRYKEVPIIDCVK